jgi:hypothetical protein
MRTSAIIFSFLLCLTRLGYGQETGVAQVEPEGRIMAGSLDDYPAAVASNDSVAAVAAAKSFYTPTSSRYFRVSYERGYCMPVDDKESVNNLLRSSTFINFSFAGAWEVNPRSVYARIYRKPLLGFGFSALSFRNSQLGNPFMIYGFTEVPVTNQNRRLHLSYGIGLGLAWGFNQYNKDSNPVNEAIGSYVNPHLQASLNLGYWLTNKVRLSIGTGFRHYSNGSIRKPNAGVNVIPLQLMAQFRTREVFHEGYVPVLPAFRKHMSYIVYLGGGMKQMEINGPMMYKLGAGFNAGYHISYKYRIVAGFDITHSSGSDIRVSGNASAFSKSISYGPYVGWDWYLTERLFIPVHIGAYIHRNYENDEANAFYQRLGIRYRMLKNKSLSAGVALRSHFGNADFVEFSIGHHF